MPESVKDRPVRSHEYIFMLTKSEKYYYDYAAVLEPGVTTKTRRQRTVWSVTTSPFSGEHFATFPTSLIVPCVLSATRPGDFILDPFFGSGTVGLVCNDNCRKFIGIELNPDYVQIAASRLNIEFGNIFKLAS
jgi:site-specific DNA-methyltransferase (adenine-specific)